MDPENMKRLGSLLLLTGIPTFLIAAFLFDVRMGVRRVRWSRFSWVQLFFHASFVREEQDR